MIKFFKKFFRYLAVGFKVAENEMLTQKDTSNSNDVSIVEVQEENRLSKDLLKGEVTQQVEELRYRNYKVNRESKHYQYLGEGQAIKKEVKEKSSSYSFSINNNLVCGSVLDGFKSIETNDFGIDKFTLTIITEDIPRFRLESYCKVLDIDINEDVAYLKLHFSAFYDKYDSRGKTFVNELDKLENVSSEYEIKRNEICSNIKSISFVTYKASNEDDLMLYTFNDIEYVEYYKNAFEFIITYKSKTYDKVDLTDKFYSSTMDKKYQSNEKKDVIVDMDCKERVAVCDICGKTIPLYDADITKEDFGYSMCVECLEKKLIEENKI